MKIRINIKELSRAVKLDVGDNIVFASNSSAIGKIVCINHSVDADLLKEVIASGQRLSVEDDWNVYGRFTIKWSDTAPDHMQRIKSVSGRHIRKI